MNALFQPLELINNFIVSGGVVLWLIFFISLALWTLIIERYHYIWVVYPAAIKMRQQQWNNRIDKTSWNAIKLREAIISIENINLTRSLALINVMVMLCPMLGLLGTVTGMIAVFDVMSVLGNGNARAMASGIYMATIPTMAGLATALSGFYFSARLKHHVKILIAEFENSICANSGDANA